MCRHAPIGRDGLRAAKGIVIAIPIGLALWGLSLWLIL